MDFVQSNLGDIGSVASFLTISVTLMGAVALLLSNLARYIQAKKFGIPIKAVSQATMGDSAAIWILLIRALGFGVFVPIVTLYLTWFWWAALPLIAISFYFALTSTITTRFVYFKKREFRGKAYVIEKEYSHRYIAVISVFASAAFMRVRTAFQYVIINDGNQFAQGFVGHSLFWLSAILMGLYALLLAHKFYSGIGNTLFGGSESMVVEIEGQKYLVAMRNSHYHWILVPCEPDVVVTKRRKDGNYSTQNFMRFRKGIFIIRDMSTIGGSIKRMNYYTPVDMGVPEDEMLAETASILDEKTYSQPLASHPKPAPSPPQA